MYEHKIIPKVLVRNISNMSCKVQIRQLYARKYVNCENVFGTSSFMGEQEVH